MNWFQENKFVGGFLIAVVVAAGVLAFLAVSARAKFASAHDDFEAKKQNLQRLHGLTPFPEDQNLRKLRDQAKEIDVRNRSLQEQLLAAELPLDGSVTPERFQDMLKQAVTEVTAKAAEQKVELPQGFYLGFEPYEAAPPRPEAAPLLARQLKALTFIFNRLIDAKVTRVNAIGRVPLPEEGASGGAAAAPTSAAQKPQRPGPGGGRQQQAPVDLVKVEPFNLSFTAEPSKVRSAVNAFAAAKQPYLVVRVLQIANEQPKAPAKAETAQPAEGAAPEGEKPKLQFLLGTEKLNVTARIEMLDFADLAAANTKPTTKQ